MLLPAVVTVTVVAPRAGQSRETGRIAGGSERETGGAHRRLQLGPASSSSSPLEDIRLVLREFCLTSDVKIHSVFAKLGELCRSSGGGADGADGDLAGLAAKIQAGAGRRLSRKRSCSELSRLFADAKARDGPADNHQATPA